MTNQANVDNHRTR